MKFNSKNIQLGMNVQLGNNVKIGDNTVIYDNVIIGDNSVIANNCIIGEPTTGYYNSNTYSNPETIIGKNCLIRSHTIIYCNNNIGDGLTTGHGTIIREKNTIGRNCTLGNNVEILPEATIGQYCKIHSKVIICEHAKIGDFVMFYCYVMLANSPTPPAYIHIAPEIGDYSVIAVHAVLLPGCKIGQNCLVAANSTVTKEFEDYSVIMGSPAKKVADIRTIPSKEKEGAHYPWMLNYDLGMPWQGIGYKKWRRKNESR